MTADAHPPAFYLLLRGVGYLTWDFVALRWVPLLFGAAAVWAFWLVGRELGGRGPAGVVAGVVAAGWLAVSPDAIVLSQVLRPYTMVVFFLAAALATLLRYRRDPTDGRLVAYTVFLVLAILTHYSAALALGTFSLLVIHDAVSGQSRGRPLRFLLIAHAVPCLLFVGLYLVHVSSTLDSPLMDRALGAGGWREGSPGHRDAGPFWASRSSPSSWWAASPWRPPWRDPTRRRPPSAPTRPKSRSSGGAS